MRIRRAEGGDHYSIFYGALAAFLFFSSSCRGVLVNRTIDSQFGDRTTGFVPSYHSPRHAWDDQTCHGCYIEPDPALTFDGTWMAATYHPQLRNINFTLEFTGVSIWVFFILSNANGHGPDTTTNTQCNFTLDGELVGNFSHDPDLTTYDLIYNATVFSKTGLKNKHHQLLVSVNDYPDSTFVNFDWAIYTTDADLPTSTSAIPLSTVASSPVTASSSHSASQGSVPSSKKSSNLGVILGSIFGVLGGGVIGAIITWLWMRRSRNVKNFDMNSFHYVEPIVAAPYDHRSFFPDDSSYRLSYATYPDNSGPGGGNRAGAFVMQTNEYTPPVQREVDYLATLRSGTLAK